MTALRKRKSRQHEIFGFLPETAAVAALARLEPQRKPARGLTLSRTSLQHRRGGKSAGRWQHFEARKPFEVPSPCWSARQDYPQTNTAGNAQSFGEGSGRKRGDDFRLSLLASTCAALSACGSSW